MAVNERIKKLRKSLGLTQVEFGHKVGIKQGQLTGIERGKTVITEKTIKAISSVLSVSENWLRTGEGEMYSREDSHNKVICLFSELNPEHQIFILTTIENLLEIQRKTQLRRDNK